MQKNQKESTIGVLSCGKDTIRLVFRSKNVGLCRNLIKRRRGPRALFGSIIIHYPLRFVNIHFARFFVAIFGEKYSMKKFGLFVVVLFVYFAEDVMS